MAASYREPEIDRDGHLKRRTPHTQQPVGLRLRWRLCGTGTHQKGYRDLLPPQQAFQGGKPGLQGPESESQNRAANNGCGDVGGRMAALQIVGSWRHDSAASPPLLAGEKAGLRRVPDGTI